MASKERPGPAFVALRAATLGIDDLSRQALRAWVSDALDHRGERLADRPDPTEEATRTIVAGVLTLTAERAAYRLWLVRWTDYPAESSRRSRASDVGKPFAQALSYRDATDGHDPLRKQPA